MNLRTILLVLLSTVGVVYLIVHFFGSGWGLSTDTHDTIEGGATGAAAGLLLWLVLDLLGRKRKEP